MEKLYATGTETFFSPLPNDLQINETEYAKAEICITMADAIARTTNNSVYIIDYNRKNFLYVSSNPLFLCGRTTEEVKEKGYGFYFEVVPPEEIHQLMEINEAGFRFYYEQPPEKRLSLTIEYDFHICTSQRHRHLIHHKLTPSSLAARGHLAGALHRVPVSQQRSR